MRLFLLSLSVLASLGVATASPVELLHNVPCEVIVSSAVESKTITPAQLVDGDRATAWNSTTGDLVGAWVEVTLPAEVTVEQIKLVVGHTGKGEEGDYFPMNHRIKKLRILRNGVRLADVSLDPDSRELQQIKVGRPGGVFRLQVLATVPGTKRSWREIAIAELEVWGTLPAGMTARHHSVKVGRATDVRARWDDPPVLKRAVGKARPFDVVCNTTNCTAGAMTKLEPKDARFKTIAVETATRTGYARYYIETEAGWWFMGAATFGVYSEGATVAAVEQLAFEDGYALITVDQRAPTTRDHVRLFTICTIAPDGTPACLNHVLPVEVINTKHDVRWQHVIKVANGYLSVDRGTLDAWENLIGDHKLVIAP